MSRRAAARKRASPCDWLRHDRTCSWSDGWGWLDHRTRREALAAHYCWSMSRHMAGPGHPGLTCMSMEQSLIEPFLPGGFPEQLHASPSKQRSDDTRLFQRAGKCSPPGHTSGKTAAWSWDFIAAASYRRRRMARKRYRPESMVAVRCARPHARASSAFSR